MKIIGERVLLERVEKEKKGGFETAEAVDDFVSVGRVVQAGEPLSRGWLPPGTMLHFAAQDPDVQPSDDLAVGNVVLFQKYSPDTQEVELDGKKMKIVATADIIAIL